MVGFDRRHNRPDRLFVVVSALLAFCALILAILALFFLGTILSSVGFAAAVCGLVIACCNHKKQGDAIGLAAMLFSVIAVCFCLIMTIIAFIALFSI